MNQPTIIFYEHSLNDSQVQRLSKSVLNLGNECRAWAEENTRLKAEVIALQIELADAQENYHLVNEMVAKLIKEGKPSV